MRLLFSLFIACLLAGGAQPSEPPEGIFFHFKKRKMLLLHPMRNGKVNFLPRGRFSDRKLDTLSNSFDAQRNHVEIIRQDHPAQPTVGVAFAFEFDEENGEYPYTPAYAVLQLKNFGWGGVEFSPRDTMNYTGVSNAVSDDLTIEILDFQNDTLSGKFSGVLLSGAGTMASLDSGSFKVRLYRK
jgi:hypothetical protein